jgi:predicted CoA-binding protein
LNKKTLVIGGSTNTSRFSNRAIRELIGNDVDVVSIGMKESSVSSVDIDVGKPGYSDIHTVTMYIRPSIQSEYYDYVIGLNPDRIIFNPGTENNEFAEIAKKNNIEVVENCTLVMLYKGIY